MIGRRWTDERKKKHIELMKSNGRNFQRSYESFELYGTSKVKLSSSVIGVSRAVNKVSIEQLNVSSTVTSLETVQVAKRRGIGEGMGRTETGSSRMRVQLVTTAPPRSVYKAVLLLLETKYCRLLHFNVPTSITVLAKLAHRRGLTMEVIDDGVATAYLLHVHQYNYLLTLFYSLMNKFVDVDCALVVCCHSGRRRSDPHPPGGVKQHLYLLRESQPGHKSVTTMLYTKQRADIGHQKAGRVVFSHPASNESRSRRNGSVQSPIAAYQNSLPNNSSPKWGHSGSVDRNISSGATVAQWIEIYQVGPQWFSDYSNTKWGRMTRAVPSGATVAQWIEIYQVGPQWFSDYSNTKWGRKWWLLLSGRSHFRIGCAKLWGTDIVSDWLLPIAKVPLLAATPDGKWVTRRSLVKAQLSDVFLASDAILLACPPGVRAKRGHGDDQNIPATIPPGIQSAQGQKVAPIPDRLIEEPAAHICKCPGAHRVTSRDALDTLSFARINRMGQGKRSEIATSASPSHYVKPVTPNRHNPTTLFPLPVAVLWHAVTYWKIRPLITPQDEVDRSRWLRAVNLHVPTLNCFYANTASEKRGGIRFESTTSAWYLTRNSVDQPIRKTQQPIRHKVESQHLHKCLEIDEIRRRSSEVLSEGEGTNIDTQTQQKGELLFVCWTECQHFVIVKGFLTSPGFMLESLAGVSKSHATRCVYGTVSKSHATRCVYGTVSKSHATRCVYGTVSKSHATRYYKNTLLESVSRPGRIDGTIQLWFASASKATEIESVSPSRRWGRGGILVRLVASHQGVTEFDARRGQPRISACTPISLAAHNQSPCPNIELLFCQHILRKPHGLERSRWEFQWITGGGRTSSVRDHTFRTIIQLLCSAALRLALERGLQTENSNEQRIHTSQLLTSRRCYVVVEFELSRMIGLLDRGRGASAREGQVVLSKGEEQEIDRSGVTPQVATRHMVCVGGKMGGGGGGEGRYHTDTMALFPAAKIHRRVERFGILRADEGESRRVRPCLHPAVPVDVDVSETLRQVTSHRRGPNMVYKCFVRIVVFFYQLRTQLRTKVQHPECFNWGHRWTWDTAAWDNTMTSEGHAQALRSSAEVTAAWENGRSPGKPTDQWHRPARFSTCENSGGDPAGNRTRMQLKNNHRDASPGSTDIRKAVLQCKLLNSRSQGASWGELGGRSDFESLLGSQTVMVGLDGDERPALRAPATRDDDDQLPRSQRDVSTRERFLPETSAEDIFSEYSSASSKASFAESGKLYQRDNTFLRTQ
ncbi:hypothetical protein PR048_030223 [Dryococelus australis]|uniref:Uncharacterized protein n=1 Tax=Dryococelus australis TaxID=614101 RepID=A0ABQ9G8C7_9NEOP|nr:hypothetical protein PR048_030223 [Dryococelus australis]